ncbi:MAG: YdeI/OmpD-associated family protein [Anaerolineae bacterium]|nr:YdeI/OmpD-associated family protein [Phycisphaerae bacterium]
MKNDADDPRFFKTPAAFRRWLHSNHVKARELWVGFHKVGSGKPSITWPQSVDEALCVGWIDGIRKRCDEHSYVIRFTPRKSTSVWSAVNINRIGELIAEQRVLPAGIAAFERRSDARSKIYAYEQRDAADFAPALKKQFRANKAAWKFFEAQAPWYRRKIIWWITSAKQQVTQAERLKTLIDACEQGRRL